MNDAEFYDPWATATAVQRALVAGKDERIEALKAEVERQANELVSLTNELETLRHRYFALSDEHGLTEQEVARMRLGRLGPILGDVACQHEQVRYYNGIEGTYAACQSCGGHFWDCQVSDGAEVVDLVNFKDEEPDECSHGVAWNEKCADCEEQS